MKRFLAIALILCAFCSASFAFILFSVDAPHDDRQTRASLRDRPELIPLHDEYTNFVQTRLWPLKFSEIEKTFGPKLETTTNWLESGMGPSLKKYPADRVLPLFAPTLMTVSGLQPPHPAKTKSHTDLYAVGDIGYVELYSQIDGEQVQTALIYFRVDSAFTPLKSTNDFPARLQWEKDKFNTLKSWFDKHLQPAQK